MRSIPEEVLAKIEEHRPHLKTLADNIRKAPPHLVRILEKRLADTYLDGETHLSPLETWRLAYLCGGGRYGAYED